MRDPGLHGVGPRHLHHRVAIPLRNPDLHVQRPGRRVPVLPHRPRRVGRQRPSPFCLLRLYLIALVLAIATEIGGLIALSILDTKLEMVLLNGWAEVNQGTRNIVQNKFNCCGFYGPKEFAYTNYPLSNSCYDGATETDADAFTNAQQLKQTGCGAPLKFWMDDNKAIWCSVLAGLGGLQLMCVILCIHIIHKLKDKSGYKRTSSKRRLHDEKSAYSL
nr:tetraspanin-2A-like isoform X1 [Penaeus vannamei]